MSVNPGSRTHLVQARSTTPCPEATLLNTTHRSLHYPKDTSILTFRHTQYQVTVLRRWVHERLVVPMDSVGELLRSCQAHSLSWDQFRNTQLFHGLQQFIGRRPSD